MHISQIENEDERLEAERAMVFLETHGSTSYAPEPWNGYKWAEDGYAPEWLEHSDLNNNLPETAAEVDHDDCVTVLDYGFGEIEPPAGYAVAYSYGCGEKACPWCGDGTGNESMRPDCKLCEGDGCLADDWQVVVFAPLLPKKHWIAGSGQPGCLYDYGPSVSQTKEAAIDDLEFVLLSELGPSYKARVRRDLENDCIHRFDRRIRPYIGASYCEITECDCRGSDHSYSDVTGE